MFIRTYEHNCTHMHMRLCVYKFSSEKQVCVACNSVAKEPNSECDCTTNILHRAIIMCLQHRKQDILGHKFKDDSEVEKAVSLWPITQYKRLVATGNTDIGGEYDRLPQMYRGLRENKCV